MSTAQYGTRPGCEESASPASSVAPGMCMGLGSGRPSFLYHVSSDVGVCAESVVAAVSSAIKCCVACGLAVRFLCVV